MQLFNFYFTVALLGQVFTLVNGLGWSDTTIVNPGSDAP